MCPCYASRLCDECVCEVLEMLPGRTTGSYYPPPLMHMSQLSNMSLQLSAAEGTLSTNLPEYFLECDCASQPPHGHVILVSILLSFTIHIDKCARNVYMLYYGPLVRIQLYSWCLQFSLLLLLFLFLIYYFSDQVGIKKIEF